MKESTKVKLLYAWAFGVVCFGVVWTALIVTAVGLSIAWLWRHL